MPPSSLQIAEEDRQTIAAFMARRYVASEPYPGVRRPESFAVSKRSTPRGPPSRGSDGSARRDPGPPPAEVEVMPAQEEGAEAEAEPEHGWGGREAEQVQSPVLLPCGLIPCPSAL